MTFSQLEQEHTLHSVLHAIAESRQQHHELTLISKSHIRFLLSSLDRLPSNFVSLDASRTWIQYWILHSLVLLGYKLSPYQSLASSSFLALCQSPFGGFAGGPMPSLPHTVATYSAVMALATIGTEESYSVINRRKLYDFLLSVKHSNGSFRAHEDGECDVRAVYCALSVAKLCNILTPELVSGTSSWLAQCQAQDGGFGAIPYGEPHAGYTYCASACLEILSDYSLVSVERLRRWLALRQKQEEGGFDGRPHKLVDSCYSFWVLGAMACVNKSFSLSLNGSALETYVLGACQGKKGGLRDKPGKPVDFYHSCYSLSGLSLSSCSTSSLLVDVDPVYNISRENSLKATQWFQKQEIQE
ncbi:hypothetical protein RCL1_002621 [Eukaryota sp. TZLM3-RCL]